ncbi:MAG: HAD family hydrolase [Brevinema sp.]
MAKNLVIFDFYNTLIVDQAIIERKKYCIDAVWSFLEKEGLPIRFKQVIEAFDETIEYSTQSLYDSYFSYSIFELVRYFCAKLSLTNITHLKKVYDIWAFASLHIPPQLLPHIKKGLQEIKESGKKIALISNTAFTPGDALRFYLYEEGIYYLFDDLVFSDEFGFSKPHLSIFNRVLDRLEVSCSKTVFVGDHELYDKKGASDACIDYIYMCPKIDFRTVVKEILSL